MYKLSELKVRRRAWVQAAGIPAARLGWTLEDCKESYPADIALISRWVDSVKKGNIIRSYGTKACGRGLLMAGAPGRGKSTIASALLQDMLINLSQDSFSPKEGTVLIRPCYFTTFNNILDLKGELIGNPDSDNETLYYGMLGECVNDSYNIRVLVIDDVGKEHSSLSGWQKNMLHHVLRTRFNNGLPTIVTTNIELAEWASLYGDATESFAREAFAYLPISASKGDLRK